MSRLKPDPTSYPSPKKGERQVQGTGLGLPISRSLVRAHGGELWVASHPAEGSAFFFTLPAAPHRERMP